MRRVVALGCLLVLGLSASSGYEAARAPRPSVVEIVVTNEVRGRDRRCGCQGARPPEHLDRKIEVPVCSCNKSSPSFSEVSRTLPDLGSLPERSSFLSVLRKNGNPIVSLDTGDLLFPHLGPTEVEREEWRRRAELLVEGYGILGVQAIAPGEIDLALGRDALREILAQARFTTVSANLADARTGARLFPGRTIVRAGRGSNARIGVVGLFAPPETPELRTLLSHEGLTALDPAASLAPEVRALRDEGVDLVVLLAHAPEDVVRELVRKVDGIDLAFASHAEVPGTTRGLLEGKTAVALALRGGGAPISASVFLYPGVTGVTGANADRETRYWLKQLDGQLANQTKQRATLADGPERKALDEQIAWVHIKIDETKAKLPDGPRNDLWIVAVPLEARDWREGKDPELLRAIERFKVDVSSQPLPAETVARLEQPGLRDGAVLAFRTESQCSQCHAKQGQVWAASPHARAWEPLTRSHDELDPDCVRCHSIGFRAPGGYADPRRVTRPRDDHPELNYDFRNVQCEACHGPRAAHPERHDVGIHFPGIETCQKCHDAEHDPSFGPKRIEDARGRGVTLCTRN